MPRTLHEYCVYFDGLHRGYHWTQLKDYLRGLIQYPGPDLGYVQPLGGSGVMAAYIRLRHKDVAQRIYNALASSGFGGLPLRVVLFDCTTPNQPQVIQSNFNFADSISAQAAPHVTDARYSYQQITYPIGTGFQYMSMGQQVLDAREAQPGEVSGQATTQYATASATQQPIQYQTPTQQHYQTQPQVVSNTRQQPLTMTAQATQGSLPGGAEPRIVNGSVDAGSESIYSPGVYRR